MIELDRERTLRARVLDLEGRPVPEAEVRALDRDDNSLSLRTRPESFATFVYTDPEGRVNLAGLPECELTLLALRGALCTAVPVEIAAESAGAEIELRLAVIAPRSLRPLALELACLAETTHERAELRIVDANARPCALLALARDAEGWFARLPEVRRLPRDRVLRFDLPAEALELQLVLGGEEQRAAIAADASTARIE